MKNRYCRHCGRGPLVLRARGLCWPCHDQPEIRDRYPVTDPSRRLTEAQRALAGHPAHVRFARRYARYYASLYPLLADEIQSAALFALVEVARRYDPTRGKKFTSLLVTRIRGAVLDAIREANPKGYRRVCTGPNVYPFTSCAAAGERSSASRADLVISQDLPVGWEIESADEVRAITAGLLYGEREILRLIHLQAATSTRLRAGRVLRITESRASQLFHAGLRHLRKRRTRCAS